MARKHICGDYPNEERAILKYGDIEVEITVTAMHSLTTMIAVYRKRASNLKMQSEIEDAFDEIEKEMWKVTRKEFTIND